jgi:hypothetical protein
MEQEYDRKQDKNIQKASFLGSYGSPGYNLAYGDYGLLAVWRERQAISRSFYNANNAQLRCGNRCQT